MSSYTNAPTFKIHKSGQFEVVDGFRYYIGEKGSDVWVDIPPGFLTDFASFPKIFTLIWSPHDPRWSKAAIVHDFLISNYGYYFDHGNKFKDQTRFFGDRIFHEAMLVSGTPPPLAKLFFLAVAAYGVVQGKTNQKIVCTKSKKEYDFCDES